MITHNLELLMEYNRRKTKYEIRQRTEHLYYIRQQIYGVVMIAIAVLMPLIADGDATVSLFALPLGVFLLLTREKVIIF